MDTRQGKAIVIGGSMGGLTAARVLADHFQQVTILDRDQFPAVGEQRKGVPQGRHTHGLLASGGQTLDAFFPGFTADLAKAGAASGDIVRDSRWFFEGGCSARAVSGLKGVLASRPLLEGMFRQRVLGLGNVTAVENTVVEGLAKDETGKSVIGVFVNGEVLPADLVVDASGRGSHMPDWLRDMGYPAIEEERVEIALAYSTRLFRRKGTHLDGDVAAIVPPTPSGKRGGVMLAQEGDRWTVTLVSHFGPAAPLELPGFIEFAKTLPAPFIYDTIRDAEPIGDGIPARFPASVRRRYERAASFPPGLLVFGDAICSFNPIYGQGMSTALLEGVALDKELVKGSRDLAKRFFAAASKVVDIPWGIAVGNDLRMPEAVGPRSASVNFINWYMAKLHKTAHHDEACSLAFHRVANLLAPPPSVMKPSIAARVLWFHLSGRSRTHAPVKQVEEARA